MELCKPVLVVQAWKAASSPHAGPYLRSEDLLTMGQKLQNCTASNAWYAASTPSGSANVLQSTDVPEM